MLFAISAVEFKMSPLCKFLENFTVTFILLVTDTCIHKDSLPEEAQANHTLAKANNKSEAVAGTRPLSSVPNKNAETEFWAKEKKIALLLCQAKEGHRRLIL